MRTISLFSGVGGLDLGLHRAGHQIVHQCEADEWRRSILAAHWSGTPISSDVRTMGLQPTPRTPANAHSAEPDEASGIHTSTIPRADLVAGGFPCQDVSVAGKRAGLAGQRTSLFHHATRIIDLIQPRWVLLENVPGLLSSNGGRDFGVVLSALADRGYGVAWRILDARYFGVPQRRRRVFIVGCLGGVESAPRALHALQEGLPGDPPTSRSSWQNPASRTPSSVGSGGVVTSITRRMHKGTDSDGNHVVANALDRQRGGVDDNSAQANHIVTAFHATQDPISGVVAPSLGKNMSVCIIPGVRRLTPTEAERLMSWPDDWTNPHNDASDSRRYSACGDGVVSNVAEWIGRRISALDEEQAA